MIFVYVAPPVLPDLPVSATAPELLGGHLSNSTRLTLPQGPEGFCPGTVWPEVSFGFFSKQLAFGAWVTQFFDSFPGWKLTFGSIWVVSECLFDSYLATFPCNIEQHGFQMRSLFSAHDPGSTSTYVHFNFWRCSASSRFDSKSSAPCPAWSSSPAKGGAWHRAGHHRRLHK